MKKLISLLLAMVMCFSLVACSSSSNDDAADDDVAEDGVITIETLTIGFVPSRDPDEVLIATEPLKQMIIDELALVGYDVQNVEITVGTNYEVVAEGLSAGTIDIGLIPGSTYVLYDDGCEVILTATRDGLTNDSDDAIDWNMNKPTEGDSSVRAVSYRALIIAGPSEAGQAVAAKVNAGEELTWEDLDSLTWSVMSTTSPAGYIYPSLWLQENYGMGISDLSNAVVVDSYSSAFARLASGQTDVLVTYADARRDNADSWTTTFGRTESIWDETNVIGVTPGIYNDTVSVSLNSDIMDEALKTAVANAFLNIADTEEGLEVIAIYNHDGYMLAESSDYDSERDAQALLQALSS